MEIRQMTRYQKVIPLHVEPSSTVDATCGVVGYVTAEEISLLENMRQFRQEAQVAKRQFDGLDGLLCAAPGREVARSHVASLRQNFYLWRDKLAEATHNKHVALGHAE